MQSWTLPLHVYGPPPAALPAGTAAAVAVGWGDTGFYEASANEIGISTAGVSRGSIDATDFALTIPLRLASGTVGAPSYSFTSGTNDGWWLNGAGSVQCSSGGSGRFQVDASFVQVLGSNQLRIQPGAVTAPGLCYAGPDNDTGFYRLGADDHAVTAGGVQAMRWKTVSGAAQIGCFGVTPAGRQTEVDLTNSVTAGGTDDTIANFTDLSTYANDAAAIRNDIYQLARKVARAIDALQAYGLM